VGGSTPGGSGEGSQPGDIAPGQEANPEFARQATELVLKRVQDSLERGDVDPQLLEDLGWTPEQMQRFVERMGRELNRPADTADSPAAAARQLQFEEMLKSLQLDRQGRRREAGEQPSREVQQVDSRRAPVPSEYRKAFEAYQKRLAKQPAKK
jgi:hypothetical protein